MKNVTSLTPKEPHALALLLWAKPAAMHTRMNLALVFIAFNLSA